MQAFQTIAAPKQRTAVIICAYTEERWYDLVAAVASVLSQSLPPDEIVIVIDHNPALLTRAREQFPEHCIVENTGSQGLSNARNTGIAASNADLLAFLDDDAVAHPNWLEALCVAMDKPDVVVAGGYVAPQWLERQPRWLPEEFYWVVGCSHRGLPTQIAEVRNPIGASMIIQRRVFDTVGMFSSDMGRVGSLPVGCEETELCIRARQQIPGAKILFVPAAVVDHKVPAKRTSWRYFSARCYAEGISKALVAQMVGSKDGLSAERAHVLKALPLAFFRSLADVFKGDAYGLARAGAIFAGLFLTVLGYVRGRTAPRQTHPIPPIQVDDMPRPMRVLLVSAHFFPHTGGTETHTYEVAKRFAAEGHQVTVLTTDPDGTLSAQEKFGEMIIKRVPAYPKQMDYCFAPGIYSVIQSRQWDVIHIQGYHTFVAPLAMLSAWRAGIPYVVTFHSGGHSSSFRTMLRWLQRLLLKPLLTHATQLIGVSNFEADFFATHLGIDRKRFLVIPNGAHLPRLDHPRNPEPYPLIVSSGRLERYKGHQHVIAAFSKVLQRRSDARLRIAGSGPYESDLNKIVDSLGMQDYVEIRGIPATNRQGMTELLSRSALVVLFSEYEAHPVAVMEALSLKRPVLVADTSGMSELAQRGLVRAVPAGCGPDALAEAILQQLDHPLIPTDVKLPTWEECSTQLLDVYQQVLQRAKVRMRV